MNQRLIDQKQFLVNFWRKNFSFGNQELDAFMSVNRENFVPDALIGSAYEDVPLPLMRGKTISQPTTVMMMTAALELKSGDKVFEVGTGSGYQAAIIAKIIGENGKVVSSEIIPELVMYAKRNLIKAGISNVSVFEDDGSKGIESEAPFDKVILTAACRNFPKPLLEHLKPDGVILGPVGSRHEQEMVKGIKRANGRFEFEFLGQFVFTPMHGKYGFID